MPSNHLILWALFFCLQFLPSIRVFSSESGRSYPKASSNSRGAWCSPLRLNLRLLWLCALTSLFLRPFFRKCVTVNSFSAPLTCKSPPSLLRLVLQAQKVFLKDYELSLWNVVSQKAQEPTRQSPREGGCLTRSLVGWWAPVSKHRWPNHREEHLQALELLMCSTHPMDLAPKILYFTPTFISVELSSDWVLAFLLYDSTA